MCIHMRASKIGCLATCDSFRILDFGEVIIYIQYPAQLATGAKNGIMVQFSSFMVCLVRVQPCLIVLYA